MSNVGETSHTADTLRFPKLIVFVSSFCLMVIEIIAGRLMAPYLGVSLYTWTSIIGVVLAGISVGNYLGGKAADSFPKKSLLAFSFLFSGITASMIIFFSDIIGAILTDSNFPLPLSTFFYSLVVFFIPSMSMSLITPIVIKLSLKNLETTGKTVGQIYAFSTIGSILGTLFTGYFLIAWVGTKMIIIAVAIILAVMGICIGFDALKVFGKKSFFFLLLLIISGSFISSNCLVESNYYCIQIKHYEEESGDSGYSLRLDHLVHSYVSSKGVKNLGYKYEKSFALVNQYFVDRNNFRLLFLGGGGYVLPRMVEEVYPETKVEVVEIDPMVTKVNFDKLGLNKNTKIITYNQDARIFFQKLSDNDKYNIIFGDVFNDLSVPYHLTTKEFNEKIKNHLTSDGLYAVNIIDEYDKGSFLPSYIHTLSQTFSFVYLVPLDVEWQKKASNRNTFVVIAGDKEIDLKRWKLASKELLEIEVYSISDTRDVEYLVYKESLQEAMLGKKTILLTDDYVPVDNMLAKVFRNKYRN